jgi:hypothetical protein
MLSAMKAAAAEHRKLKKRGDRTDLFREMNYCSRSTGS